VSCNFAGMASRVPPPLSIEQLPAAPSASSLLLAIFISPKLEFESCVSIRDHASARLVAGTCCSFISQNRKLKLDRKSELCSTILSPDFPSFSIRFLHPIGSYHGASIFDVALSPDEFPRTFSHFPATSRAAGSALRIPF